MKNLLLSGFLITVLSLAFFPPLSHAQLNNRPFAFKGSPDGSVGMSQAGRQLIFNQKITGATPDNVMKLRGGGLLTITKGKGGIPIVTTSSGEVLPTYKGSSFRGGNFALSAGAFNAFFTPAASDRSGSGSGVVKVTSAAVVNTWTGRVVTDGPVSYSPASSVDNWTGMVFY